jgi:predicted outer membrane protein
VKWTDAQILAALVTAEEGREDEARIARERSKSARVERLARDMIDNDRELDRDLAGLETHLASEPSELRKKVADARIAASESFRGTSNIGFDLGFVEAEARFDQALLHLLDEEMLPSASSQRLRAYLQTLRSKTQADLNAAEQVQNHLH